MEKLNFEELNKIPIPEGFEEELSMKIDEWEAERNAKAKAANPKPRKSRIIYMAAGIAASIAIIIAVGFNYLNNSTPQADQDTYDDPAIARAEAEKAVELLARNLNHGMTQYEKVNKACKMLNTIHKPKQNTPD